MRKQRRRVQRAGVYPRVWFFVLSSTANISIIQKISIFFSDIERAAKNRHLCSRNESMAVTPAAEASAVKNHCARLDGKVAIVTGAAQGLGRVIAHRLGDEGASVIVADIQGQRAERKARQLS